MSARSPDSTGLNGRSISSALDDARLRVSELGEQIAALGSERQAVAQEAELLERLLALRSKGVEPDAQGVVEDGGADSSLDEAPVRRKVPHPAVQEAINELEAAGRPLHISELMRLLEVRGIAIPGAGAQANLIAHLSRNEQIVRPSRGMYALASWGLAERPTLKRAKRRRVRGSVATKSAE